ncbi:hypothetical protein [Aestuariibacter sp. A3R04]|uniref:hypothetical protein n=1 Tax=Aestuariibacter sp. A3R04 TaxID=2841571 RepID=UPI001C0874E9|nr:hypothetical protein [Aestuariibacter sp. A3R04]MBU3023014.1 hypothetical protein [Aestuariibacter sp. A3R04]
MSNRATLKDIHRLVGASNTQVAAVFESERDALTTIDTLVQRIGMSESQYALIKPLDDGFSEKLEVESSKLGRSMWHSHLVLGFAGFAVGMVAAFLLVRYGPALTINNPVFTYIALISPGLFIGLFAAGLLGLRPDRTHIIEIVRSAIKRRKFALVVNIDKHQSPTTIHNILCQYSTKVVEAAR